jgi:histidine triad (HIT) family protein
MSSIFSKIIDKEIPAYLIKEDEHFIAFLDAFPLKNGHVLVVPKMEVDNMFDLPAELLSALLLFAQPIAKAIEQSFDCNRCGMSVIGLEVPHAHLHLVPIKSANDINFTQPKITPTKEEFLSAQKKIISNLK